MKHSSLFFSIGLCLLSAGLAFQPPSDTPAGSFVPAPMVEPVVDDCSSATGLVRVICLADAFKATLSATQLAVLQLTYSKADAAKWSNFPQAAARPPRVGLNLGSLNATQLKAAKTLMASVLAQGVPDEGYDELEGVLAGDDYFGATTGKNDFFGSGNYYLAFLGTPSVTGRWELQFGGHHYAVANTYRDGKITGVTPSFRGVEPMGPVTANGRTYQPIEQERQTFAALLAGLSTGEQATAKLSSGFGDVLLGPGRDGQFPATKQGLRAGELSAAKQALVLNAVKRYVNDLDPQTAAAILARYTAELANTYLAYAGSGTLNQPGDYVRIDGPHVWIEYSAQPSRDFPGTVHAHSVWRDHTSDYGGN